MLMDPKLAEAIGLLRHQIISPVLMGSGKEQMAYFKQVSGREFEVPGRGPKRFTATTMKGWLYRYRKRGFTALIPKTRSDAGGFRVLSIESREKIRRLRRDNLEHSCVRFYDLCLETGLLGHPPVCMETLRRFLKSEGLYKRRETVARKRFEMGCFGELWTCDFMHGPSVVDEGGSRRRRSILLAIIDDHSRMIVGHRWGLAENTRLIESVFKEAILAFGVPDRLYCDNGSAFSSSYLQLTCAHLNIGLVHSKPYDSPSRGKIERFFRTVRESFLVGVKEGCTLEQLGEAFGRWIREGYHLRHHRGIDGRPIDRYQVSVREMPRKRIDEERLEEYFLVEVSRTVGKDSTVSLQGTVYEVPPQYIGRRVELRFPQESPQEVYLYENGVRISRVQPVDSQLNAKTYQPSPRISDVALHSVSWRGEK
jgi:transposase InsO family protein